LPHRTITSGSKLEISFASKEAAQAHATAPLRGGTEQPVDVAADARAVKRAAHHHQRHAVDQLPFLVTRALVEEGQEAFDGHRLGSAQARIGHRGSLGS
jgi:hypothetical protein